MISQKSGCDCCDDLVGEGHDRDDHGDVEHGADDQGDDEYVGDDHADEGHVDDIHLGRDLQGGSTWKPSIICSGRAP